jgi:hypothetical protein
MALSPRLLRPRAGGFKYAALRQGLVAYWPLNETATSGDVTAKDESGKGYDLTSNNSVLSTTGKIGNARDFVATNSEFLSIASNADMQFGNKDWTLTCWIYPGTFTGQIVAKDMSGGREIEIRTTTVNSNSLQVVVYASGGTSGNNTVLANLTANTWYFYAVRSVVSTGVITIRGNASTATINRPAGQTWNSTSTALNIGRRAFVGASDYFTGRIDEVAKWDRALSDAELDAIYNSGNGINLGSRVGQSELPQVSNLDAQDWINRVYANGGTVSTATAAAVNQFCTDIENAPGGSIRDRFYRLNIFAGSNLNAALVPLYRGPSLGGTQYGGTTDTNNAFVGVGTDYSETGASGGLTGNGTSKYLDTGFNINNLTATSFHLASFIRGTQNITTPRALIGALFNGVSDRYRIFLNATGTPASTYTALSELGKVTSVLADRANSNAGLILASRTTASSLSLYDDGVSINTSSTLTAEEVSATPLLVFARTGPVEYYNGIMGAYSIGAGLNETQAAAYSTAMNAFQTAMSRT